jgi:hypothetical protein
MMKERAKEERAEARQQEQGGRGKRRTRLHNWEHHRRLLMLASCAGEYAFLLALMQPPWEGTRDWVLRFWCYRTGAWTRQALVSFTRLRFALS